MNILFISEILPVNTQASSVVFYRHLIDLEKRGHKIFILTDRNSLLREKEEIRKSWETLILPNRSLFLPPYKPYGPLKEYRFTFYYYRYIAQFLKINKIDYLTGYINGQFLAPLTSYLKKKTNLPLLTFYHDDNLELHYSKHHKTFQSLKKNTEELIIASDKVLVASDEFRLNWPKYSYKFELLFPLPEKSERVYKKIDERICVGYSGTLYNELIEPLERFSENLFHVDGKMFIITNGFKLKSDKITALPLFDTANESNLFLLQNCNAIVVPYPEHIEEMKWIKTCFPSKFIQACQLEIPIIVIAPKDSAIGKWCIKHKWTLYSENYALENLNELFSKINSEQALEDTRKAKREQFDINSIKDQFALNFQ